MRRAAARATAGVQRRRVVKKHIQQKYMLCGFAIHAFLATPAYLYGNVVESDKDMVLRIWPAIVYQATGEICRSIMEHLDTEYSGRARETTQYRRIFLLATLIACVSLMISGILFSSAWLLVSNTTQIVAIICYGCFAGIGSNLYLWKTHVILEAVRPREDKYVRKTIQLCGEAFCQLFLSFVFTSLRTLYGTAQSIVLMSALLVNLIPLSLIITKHREDAFTTKRISVIKAETGFAALPLRGALAANFVADQLDGLDTSMSWRNPATEMANVGTGSATIAAAVVDTHSSYMLATDEAYVTYVNPNGVEIMEIIPEEDETVSMMRSSNATIDNSGISQSQMLVKSLSNGRLFPNSVNPTGTGSSSPLPEAFENLQRIRRMSRAVTSHLWWNLLDKIAMPLQQALLVPQLYATTLLISADIFSYVMCLTVLPGLAVSHHALKNAEIPFLFSLLAFPWMCFSLMTPRFGSSLYKRKLQWYTLGSICKCLALIFISFSTSKLLLSVSAVLLGFGQVVTAFLQELVFQLGMTRANWTAIRRPVHLTNGLLILLWGALAHWVVLHYSFQATVGLAGALYGSTTLLWNFLFFCCQSKD
ncbi:CG14195 [Drosophila busckii]|uniref:CG14195 n=2 Tax=Drosophila busckii TaxID=30019 RepID=A0A0M3QZU9_DROBS|nr:CG14195 [Drosophila busckii]